jgi:nucleotide-binding universal stress UspA family protein
MFHRILVAVDGSGHADRALAEAIDLARSQGGWLTLLYVAYQPVWLVGPSPYVLPLPSEEALREEAHWIVQAAAERVPDDVEARTVVRSGRPGDEILKQVEEGGHDLVVMGSRGRGAAGSLLLGSVSHDVLNRCRVPMLVVHGEAP